MRFLPSPRFLSVLPLINRGDELINAISAQD
jgi:hypothetical protein